MSVTRPLHSCAPTHGQLGVTLIELMIAMVVALVLLAGLAAMYGSSVKARNEIERTNRQIENGRYAIQLLRDDIQLAGFFGELNMVDTPPPLPGALPDVCVTHLSTLPSDGVVAADATFDTQLDALDYLAVSMNIHVQGFDNVNPTALTGCLAGIDLKPDTDIVVVRRVLTCDA
jgi:type IV pilus assembly protein PilW